MFEHVDRFPALILVAGEYHGLSDGLLRPAKHVGYGDLLPEQSALVLSQILNK